MRIPCGDDFAETVLSSANQSRKYAWSLADLIVAVWRRYNISEAQFRAPGKTRPYNEARAVAAYLVRESSHLSLTEPARSCGHDVSALGKAAAGLTRWTHEYREVALLIKELLADMAFSVYSICKGLPPPDSFVLCISDFIFPKMPDAHPTRQKQRKNSGAATPEQVSTLLL